MPATGEVRDLLHRTAALKRALNDLAAKMTDTSAAMTTRGVPPSEHLAQAIVAVHRAFTVVRGETIAAVSTLGVQIADHVLDSATAVETILTTVLEHAEAVEREAAAARARAEAFTILQDVARLTHRTEAAFPTLTACQVIADQTRTALESATMIDTEATAPFAALLRLVERSIVDDDQWIAPEDIVATAFGRPLAIAASRGRLQLLAAGSR